MSAITLGQLWDSYGTALEQLWDSFGTALGQLWDRVYYYHVQCPHISLLPDTNKNHSPIREKGKLGALTGYPSP